MAGAASRLQMLAHGAPPKLAALLVLLEPRVHAFRSEFTWWGYLELRVWD